MTQLFRRRVVTLLVDKQLLSEDFAENLLSWRHSGFSIDNSVRVADARTKESLAQYISRPSVSLKKIRYEPFKGRVLFHTTYSEYFKENTHLFDVHDFLAEVDVTKPLGGFVRQFAARTAQHHPAETHSAHQALRTLRFTHQGLLEPHAPRRLESAWGLARIAPISSARWSGFEPLDDGEGAAINAGKRAWARLLAKVYEIDPLVCPKCGCEDEVQFRSCETAGSSARPNCNHLPLSRIPSRSETS